MNTRILTVSSISPYADAKGKFVEVPLVRLQGKWFQKLGFHIGSKVRVYESSNAIIIKLLKD